jgi:single-strand DNA-binding protein
MVLIGRITQQATVKKTNDGRELVSFDLATNDYVKSKGNEEGTTITTYYHCAYWISTKIAARLTKGSLIEISGRIYLNSWKGMDGEQRASLNCHVNTITIHQYKKTDAVMATTQETETDLPF